MGSIKVLDKLISNMIAAGEVIERASSVVKELFENALDAGSTRITVSIREGGREYINVTDNGKGMDKSDAELCVVRYATSKLSSGDDLYSVKTMGFRGEALASICAVSKVTIDTRRENDLSGVHLECEGGEITDISDTGCPDGTRITVENLFFNTPARLKFMKKPATESAHIEELIGKLIIANPHISVRFIKDGKEIFYSSGDGDLKSAVYTVYGRAIAENIVFLNYERDGVKIGGCIGNPNIAKPSLKYETFSVNGRICRTKTLVSALENGYFQKIAQGKHPFCAVQIGIDYSLCDVNIHPQKAEVKFSDEGLVYRVLSEAVSNALNNEIYVRKTEEIKVERPKYTEETKPAVQEDIFKKHSPPPVFSTPFQEVKEFTFLRESSEPKKEKPKREEKEIVFEVEVPTPEPVKEKEIPDFKIVGQLFKTYIVIELEDEMLLLDQHAAHERMNYEMLRENSKKGTASQILLTPKIIELSPSEHKLALLSKELFSNLGFEIDDFSGNSIVLRSVPSNIQERYTERLIYEIINEIDKSGDIKSEEFNQRMLYLIACKMSIKANMDLHPKEAQELTKKAFELRGNATCPHGRPLFISFAKSYIEGKFER